MQHGRKARVGLCMNPSTQACADWCLGKHCRLYLSHGSQAKQALEPAHVGRQGSVLLSLDHVAQQQRCQAKAGQTAIPSLPQHLSKLDPCARRCQIPKGMQLASLNGLLQCVAAAPRP